MDLETELEMVIEGGSVLSGEELAEEPTPTARGRGSSSPPREPQKEPKVNLKVCSVCGEKLPEDHFPRTRDGRIKGSTCIKDDRAIESLQGQLRALWGTSYKEKYASLKRDRASWLQQIKVLRAGNSGGRGHKRVKVDSESLTTKSSKGKVHRRRTALALDCFRFLGDGRDGRGRVGGWSGDARVAAGYC